MTPNIDCVNFICEANFDNKKLGHVSWKLSSSSRWTKPNNLIPDKTQRNKKIFNSYGKVCRPSLFCGKIEYTTGIKNFNK